MSLNNDFLIKAIEYFTLLHQNSLMLLVDLNGKVLFVSNGLVNVFNLSDRHSLLNKHYLEINLAPKETLTAMRNSFKRVVASAETQKSLFINLTLSNPEFHALTCSESVLINPETNTIVAICIEFRKVEFPLNFQKILTMIPAKINNNQASSDGLLTRREHEIAFLLFYCKTSDEVAKIISKFNNRPITSKTVRNIIRQQLCPKLQASGHDELISKLHSFGYHKKIPRSLLRNQFIDLSLL